MKAKTGRVCVLIKKVGSNTTPVPAGSVATAAHLHQAAAGSNGPVVLTLETPVLTGKKYQQSKTCVDGVSVSLVTALVSNPSHYSVDVHTAQNPGGAIRGQLAGASSTPPPSSMAALGDSLTAGWDVCGAVMVCPAGSWATGTTLASHYERILAVNPAISGHALNLGVPGAPMSTLSGQASAAVAQGVQYVTILMGGNDVCQSSEASMTPVATFRSQFQTAMNTLRTGLPNAKILVASIPDLTRIWFIGKDNPAAQAGWASFGCATVFGNPTSTAQADVDRRARVHQRIIDLNTALAGVCASSANCKWDGNALFSHQWTPSEISTVDYLHPDLAGQSAMAAVTYAAGYGW